MKPVPDMTYNVFGGTLNLAQLLTLAFWSVLVLMALRRVVVVGSKSYLRWRPSPRKHRDIHASFNRYRTPRSPKDKGDF